MSAAAKESRYSLSGTSRSPNKPGGGGRRGSAAATADTAASASARRASAASERPDERVKVFVRIRPTKPEGETPGALKIRPDGKGVLLYREHATVPVSEFEFDGVLGAGASQSDVYHVAVKPIVEDVLNGYNGTLMAYGQTGAGKTYSLSSIAADAIGMIPRAAAEVFSHIEQDTVHEYTVYMSYVQLYMELIQDLLRPESENLQIRENEGGVFVGGVHQQEVTNITQCLHLLHLGDRNRTTAFTALNAHSSRSHAVVMLTVIKRRSVAGTGDAEIQRVKVGKLFLVDLAGSERLKKSKSTGLRANEAKSINLSLTTLGMCINARADPAATHVPFRDSKLTRLLQDSLGGNAKTSLLVATADALEHAEETLQSLQFGSRAMCVRIQAVVNERVDYKTLHAEMIAALESQDRKSSLLEASLLEKDAQLEAVQARLQQEQQEAARRLDELRREQEARDAERQRQLAEQQAALAAEQKHKAHLLQKLEASSQEVQDLAAQHEAQRAELAASVAEKEARLAEAEAAMEELQKQHAAELEAARSAAAAAEAQLTRQHEEARAAAEAAQSGALALVRQELEHTQQLLKGSRAESRMLQEHHEQQLKELEAEWAGKVKDAEAAGQRQLAAAQATVTARDGTIAQLQQDMASRDSHIVELSETIGGLEAGKAELAAQLAAAQAQLEAAAAQRRRLEAALAQERQLADELQTQVEGYERSRMALAKSFFENKTRSDAAKVIQRNWREYRLRRIRQQQSEGYQALHNAKTALGTLAQQHADLEQRRRANLVFSGQTLVGDNLGVLQDAVEALIAAFLLPARDLKTIQRYQQKVSSYGAATSARQSMAVPPLSRAGANLDLIRAINPLADSLPCSARSTPRDMVAGSSSSGSGSRGGGTGSAGDVPLAAAPLQQQYQQQQQQQQYQQQLPPGRPLSRTGSLSAGNGAGGQAMAPREGSLRGGLAAVGKLMQGAVQSPMDRLRRLSSGHFQQQAAAAQQHLY